MAPQKSARARLLVATQYQVETDAGRRNRSAAVLSATMMPVTRKAPRRSLRPTLRFRRASRTPPSAMPRLIATPNAPAMPDTCKGGVTRSSPVRHGGITSNHTGRPRHDAASTRSESRVHARRTSAAVGGVHSGSAGWKSPTENPAAPKSGPQSGSWEAGDSSARIGGTTRNDSSRPRGSSRTRFMPATTSGGSTGSTTVTTLNGASAPRLSRYQNHTGAGVTLPSDPQRSTKRSESRARVKYWLSGSKPYATETAASV